MKNTDQVIKSKHIFWSIAKIVEYCWRYDAYNITLETQCFSSVKLFHRSCAKSYFRCCLPPTRAPHHSLLLRRQHIPLSSQRPSVRGISGATSLAGILALTTPFLAWLCNDQQSFSAFLDSSQVSICSPLCHAFDRKRVLWRLNHAAILHRCRIFPLLAPTNIFRQCNKSLSFISCL